MVHFISYANCPFGGFEVLAPKSIGKYAWKIYATYLINGIKN